MICRMVRTLNKLTARIVATLAKTGRHSDSGNLYLVISQAGARSWSFYYSRNRRHREMGLGSAAPSGKIVSGVSAYGHFRQVVSLDDRI